MIRYCFLSCTEIYFILHIYKTKLYNCRQFILFIQIKQYYDTFEFEHFLLYIPR